MNTFPNPPDRLAIGRPTRRYRNTAAAILMLLLISACAPATRSALPTGLTSRSIAVLPTNNRTGDDLLIGGASFLEQYAWHSDRTAVADILTAEASEHLTQDGFHVIASEEAATVPSDPQSAAHYVASRHLADVALYIEIRRWETEASFHPSFVIAVVDVSLVEATSGRILWTASHPARPILTPGVVSVADAYALAADEVITNLLAPFADGVR